LRTRDELEEIAGRLIERSDAEATEVLLMEQDDSLTRFANSAIHQNVAERNLEVRLRVVRAGRAGVATVNQTDDESLATLLREANAIASLPRPNAELPPLPGPAKLPAVRSYSERTAAFTPEERAAVVGEICKGATEAGSKAFGAFRTGSGQLALANSNGAFHFHRSTAADLNAVVMGADGSAYAARSAVDAGEIDGEAVAAEVVEKARRNQGAQPLEPGTYPVVLEEYAVAELLDYLNYMGFSALAHQEDRSFMRLGEEVTGANIHIWDDALDPSGMPVAFDFEGVPKQRVQLIEGGRAAGLVYDTQTAARAGRSSTGHGLPQPNTMGPYAGNLFMRPGSTPRADIAQGIKRGVWVTRFWYIRPVHAKRTIVTGMTREGTFLIEDGKVTRPVRDLRFTQSIIDAFKGAEAIGSTTHLQMGEWVGATRAPAVQLQAFTFTS
jgi:predicted Zn-dependent protease